MASDPTVIEVRDVSTRNKTKKKQNKLRRRQEKVSRPEWKYQLLICALVLMEKVSLRLGQIASVWATTVLLGGFISGLATYDFWIIAGLALASSLRIFGIDQEQKLNFKSESRRRTLFRWFYSFLVGRPKFHIAGSTVVAGVLDTGVYLLQLASAIVSVVLPVLRLTQIASSSVMTDSGSRNQRSATILYYFMVLFENLLFIPAKLAWELPKPLDKNVFFGISHDNETLSRVFNVVDSFFVEVLAAARKSTAGGLDMSLRRYVSDMLYDGRVDAGVAVFILDILYQQGEWIKRKIDAQKRAKLLPFVIKHVRETADHHSKEAGISLLNSLVLNESDTPEPSRFGPLVLFVALDSPDFVEIMTTTNSISRPVLKYLETCMGSSSRDEVYLAIRALRKMPVNLLRETRISQLLHNRALSSSRNREIQPVSLAALILITFKELGLELAEDLPVGSIVDELVSRPFKLRDLEILLGLAKHGLLTPEQRNKVKISHLFSEQNFMRSLPEIVEWYSLLEEDQSLVGHLAKLSTKRKEWLICFLRQSKGRHRPDISKLCRLLVKDAYFFQKFEKIDALRELLL